MTSKIEWLRDPITVKPGYTINPVKGLCPMACPYCYARRMYKRFHWDETLRYDDMIFQEGTPIYNGSKVFVGSTMELFGDWIKPDWIDHIFSYIQVLPKVTFIFLTKQPQNLIKWSPFPDNCWVGVSATNDVMANTGQYYLRQIQSKVKFLSLEPLLSWNIENQQLDGINWLIIGQQTPTSTKTQPKVEWINEIVEAADKAKVPVFLKENLDSIFAANDCELYKKYHDKLFRFKGWSEKGEAWHIRQEFPRLEAKP